LTHKNKLYVKIFNFRKSHLLICYVHVKMTDDDNGRKYQIERKEQEKANIK